MGYDVHPGAAIRPGHLKGYSVFLILDAGNSAAEGRFCVYSPVLVPSIVSGPSDRALVCEALKCAPSQKPRGASMLLGTVSSRRPSLSASMCTARPFLYRILRP